jgi:hypothetical protein
MLFGPWPSQSRYEVDLGRIAGLSTLPAVVKPTQRQRRAR